MSDKETQVPEKTAIGRLTIFRLCDSLVDAINSIPSDDKVIQATLRPNNDGKWISEVVKVAEVD